MEIQQFFMQKLKYHSYDPCDLFIIQVISHGSFPVPIQTINSYVFHKKYKLNTH